MAMKIYQAPDGALFRYREGAQPSGYKEPKKAKKPAADKRAEAENKAATPETK